MRSYGKYLVVEAHPHAPVFVSRFRSFDEFEASCLTLRCNINVRIKII
jgi:hypothetical protein